LSTAPTWPEVRTAPVALASPDKAGFARAPLPGVIAACWPCLREDGSGSREYMALELRGNRAAIDPVFLSAEQRFLAAPTSVQSGQEHQHIIWEFLKNSLEKNFHILTTSD